MTMNTQFTALIQKLVAKEGKDALLNTDHCKSVLAAYTKGQYIKESRLLLQAVQARIAKTLAETTALDSCKARMIHQLEEEYFLSAGPAEYVVNLLSLVLHGENATTPPPPIPRTGPRGMVRIQGGTFVMGSPDTEPQRRKDEIPHQVEVSSFYIGKYTVTQKEWREVMGTIPSYFKGHNLPVEQVSWYDAVRYCNNQSEGEGLIPVYTIKGTGENLAVSWNRHANGYRLPTEAEWEYACRVDTMTPFTMGRNITTDQANYNGNYPYHGAKGEYRKTTTPVGYFAPNLWGVYDMHGNVWEWCWDWYGDYPQGPQTDPAGADSGSFRVARGGSWYYLGQCLRSAFREGYTPGHQSYDLGFRLARSVF